MQLRSDGPAAGVRTCGTGVFVLEEALVDATNVGRVTGRVLTRRKRDVVPCSLRYPEQIMEGEAERRGVGSLRITQRDTSDSSSGEANPSQQQERRILYWWTVPERPGTGRYMLVFAGVWIGTLVVLAIVMGYFVA